MQNLGDAQVVELFHLAFLQVMQARFDQARYVLKGGTNLRYFFDSVRYSEDIDLDVSDDVEGWALAEQVDEAVESRALALVLRSGGLEVEGFTKPKQTETTRRWKVAVRASARTEPVRTRIEFSSRGADPRHTLEAVPARLVEPYALRPPTVQHYTAGAATEQKIRALAGRSETQARDVFDLDLLIRRAPLVPGSIDPKTLADAEDRALEISFGKFRDQVLPFLDPDAAELHGTEVAWGQMQTYVAEALERAR